MGIMANIQGILAISQLNKKKTEVVVIELCHSVLLHQHQNRSKSR